MSPEKRGRFLRNICAGYRSSETAGGSLARDGACRCPEPTGGKTEITPILAQFRERYKDQVCNLIGRRETNRGGESARRFWKPCLPICCDNSRQNGAITSDIDSVKSNGCSPHRSPTTAQGYHAANAENIFTPFFTTRRDEGGTGLGLGIVRSLLKAYDGEISLDSEREGATFAVTVPARKRDSG